MVPRGLEASRRISIPPDPYTLDPKHLPFGFVFARSKVAGKKRWGERDDDEASDPKPQPEATWCEPETSGSDSNDPANDEEIDWLQDD